jgi:hypothetical protein
MNVDGMLYKIRQSGGNPFRLAYVRSTGKSIGSVGAAAFIFQDYIDTNADEIKLLNVDTSSIRTLKISHILSFNQIPIKHR